MKNRLLVAIVLLVFGANIQAQEVSDHFYKKNALKISPVEFWKAEFQATYERYFGENRKSSISIMPSIILQKIYPESEEGYQIMLQYRYYLTHLRKDETNLFLGLHNIGFYAGLYGLALNYSTDYIPGFYVEHSMVYYDKVFSRSQSTFEGGVLIGLQLDITKKILLDMYLGGGIRKTDLTDTIREDPEYDADYSPHFQFFDREYNGIKPTLGLQLGILF